MNLKKYIKDIPDFPIKGIVYKDMTPILKDEKIFSQVILSMIKFFPVIDESYDYKIVGIESGGFIFGATIAKGTYKNFVRIRKPGKLPNETISEKYDLEYGSNELHIQVQDIKLGERIILVDDCLATGGTLKAAIKLIERLGGVVETIIVLQNLNLEGVSESFKDYDLKSVIDW